MSARLLRAARAFEQEQSMTDYIREIRRELECGPSPRLDIRTVHGSIKVQGVDRAGVRVSATAKLRAGSTEEADALMQAVEAGLFSEGDRVNIHSPAMEGGRSFFGTFRHAFGPHHHVEVDLTVEAPRGASVAVHHVNGAIELRGLEGDARVHLVNGDIEVSDIGGNVRLHHVNGKTEAENVGGRVDVHQTNGSVRIDRTGGDVRLHIVNGRVDITDAGRGVSVRGVSGAYSLTSAIYDHVTITNGHGTITLNLPPESRFQLDARSTLGSVTSDLEVREGDGAGGRAPRVSLRSETGNITLRALRETAAAGV